MSKLFSTIGGSLRPLVINGLQFVMTCPAVCSKRIFAIDKSKGKILKDAMLEERVNEDEIRAQEERSWVFAGGRHYCFRNGRKYCPDSTHRYVTYGNDGSIESGGL